MNTPLTDPPLRYEIAQLEMIRQHIHADLAHLRMQEENLRHYETQLRERETRLPQDNVGSVERAELDAEREKLARAGALLEAERRSLAGERLLLREERAVLAQGAASSAALSWTGTSNPGAAPSPEKSAARSPLILAEPPPVLRRLSLPSATTRSVPPPSID